MNNDDFYLPPDWAVWASGPEAIDKSNKREFYLHFPECIPEVITGIIYMFWHLAPVNDYLRPKEWDCTICEKYKCMGHSISFWFNHDPRNAFYQEDALAFNPRIADRLLAWDVGMGNIQQEHARVVRTASHAALPAEEFRKGFLIFDAERMYRNMNQVQSRVMRNMSHNVPDIDRKELLALTDGSPPIVRLFQQVDLPNAPGGPQSFSPSKLLMMTATPMRDEKHEMQALFDLIVPSSQQKIANKLAILRDRRNGIRRCLCGSYNIIIGRDLKNNGPGVCTCMDCKKVWNC